MIMRVIGHAHLRGSNGPPGKSGLAGIKGRKVRLF